MPEEEKQSGDQGSSARSKAPEAEGGADEGREEAEPAEASAPREPQKKVRKPSPDTPGGAASEDPEGSVTVADLDTAVRIPGGGVRTNREAAVKNRLPDEVGKPATVSQKVQGEKAAASGGSAEAGEKSAGKDAPPAESKSGDGGGDGAEEERPPWYEPVTRRSWLGGAWAAFAAAMGVGTLATVRFLYPNVLFEPPTRFKVGFPKDFQLGVSNLYKDKYGVWIVRNESGFYSLRAVCTHLGCTPNWLEADQKFKCPCHGSGFYITGVNFEGPAPRPLERVGISLADDGQILVDKGLTFQGEKGEWDDPRSFLQYTA